MPARALWQLAAAFFEGRRMGLLKPDSTASASRRGCWRSAHRERGDHEVSDRLAQDMLFFCAQAAAPGDGARRAAAGGRARGATDLQRAEPVDYEIARLGRFDPASIVQARKRVAGAKDAWSAVAGGELHRLAGLVEQFSLVGDSLQQAVRRRRAAGRGAARRGRRRRCSRRRAPPADTGDGSRHRVLYLDASLEDAEFDRPEQAERIRRLARAHRASAQGRRTAGRSKPWMEELYRRVSDRQTMGSVVQELRASLSEVEKLIDQFFRNPPSARC